MMLLESGKFAKEILKIKCTSWELIPLNHSIQDTKKDTKNCGVYISVFMQCLYESNFDGLLFDTSTESLLQKRLDFANTMELHSFGSQVVLP
jgi:hypothetical protein